MHPYFNDFNYSLANEDTSVEKNLSASCKSLLCVGGSGARVIPLLQGNLKKLVLVDLSRAQLNYFSLKRHLVRNLEDQDYLKFLGYHQASAEWREKLLLKLNIPQELRTLSEWKPGLEKGLIYCGHWESKLLRLSGLIRALLPIDFQAFFEAKTAQEQKELYLRLWPKKRLGLLLHLLAGRKQLNRWIYRGQMPSESEASESLPKFLLQNFEHYFSTHPLRPSFFHQLLFLGEIKFCEGLPLETQSQVLSDFRHFDEEIISFHGDLNTAIRSHQCEFLSLSDVASYLSVKELKSLEDGLSSQFAAGSKGALLRTFLKHPQLQPKFCEKQKLNSSLDVTELYQMQYFKGESRAANES